MGSLLPVPPELLRSYFEDGIDQIGGFYLSWPEYQGSSRCTVVAG